MQNKSSTRFLILSILIMAVLVIIASNLLAVNLNLFQNKEIEIAEAANYTATYDSVKPIGEAASYSQSGTKIGGDGGSAYSSWNGTGNAYLGGNITLATLFSSTNEDTKVISGTLDGNGHTITINVSAGNDVTISNGSNNYIGALGTKLTGTIKNVKIVVTRMHAKRSSATSDDTQVFIGSLFGRIVGDGSTKGILENVQITINNTVNYFDSDSAQQRRTDYFWVGGVSGDAAGAILKNVSVVVSSTGIVGSYSNTERSYVIYYGNSRNQVGGFFGLVRTSETNLYNCAISGNGTIRAQDRGNEHSEGYAGAVAGKIEYALKLHGFYYGFYGTMTAAGNDHPKVGSLVGNTRDSGYVYAFDIIYNDTDANNFFTKQPNNSGNSSNTPSNSIIGYNENKWDSNTYTRHQTGGLAFGIDFGFSSTTGNTAAFWVRANNTYSDAGAIDGTAQYTRAISVTGVSNTADDLSTISAPSKSIKYYKYGYPTEPASSASLSTYSISIEMGTYKLVSATATRVYTGTNTTQGIICTVTAPTSTGTETIANNVAYTTGSLNLHNGSSSTTSVALTNLFTISS